MNITSRSQHAFCCAAAAVFLMSAPSVLVADNPAIKHGLNVPQGVVKPLDTEAHSYKPDLPAGMTGVKPSMAFQVFKESLLTYTFPGSNYFILNFHTTKNFDPSSLNQASVSVHLKFYRNGEFVSSERLSGNFVKANSDTAPTVPSDILRWKSEQTSWASGCTGSSDVYCRIDVSLYDTVLSESGVKLDGDADGKPGGTYRHVFYRGMQTP